MKIVVYGASVSAQRVHRETKEITGYFELLRRRHLRDHELVQVTHGGNRISDAGLIRVHEVVAQRPDFCIVEPLVEDRTRGEDATWDEIVYVYRVLADAGVLPVTLLLPDPAQLEAKHWPTYEHYKRLTSEARLPVIEVNLIGVDAPPKAFRGIHTNEAGALIYTRKIAPRLAEITEPQRILERSNIGAFSSPIRLKSIDVPTNAKTRSMELAISVVGTTDTLVRIVQPQDVGPHSPVLAVDTFGAKGLDQATRSLWDDYCRFERSSYAVLYSKYLPPGDYKIHISCSTVDPDYATCRGAPAKWLPAQERHMRPTGPIYLASSGPVFADLVRYQ